MQETRQHILGILADAHEATVEQIVESLISRNHPVTHVTVRHHLTRLQEEGLIVRQPPRQRLLPGRPQHFYTLTNQGETTLPNNYRRLAQGLLSELQRTLPALQVNVIFEGVATLMASDAHIPQGTFEERLDHVVAYLNDNGYDANWSPTEQGYLLHTRNCPYHRLAEDNRLLCTMDMSLISQLLGRVPRLASHIADGSDSCSYFVPTF